jgi:hypothetical protein
MCNLESQNRPTSAASNQIPLRDPQPSRHNKSKLKFKYFFTYFITLKFSLLQSTHTKQNNLLLQKKLSEMAKASAATATKNTKNKPTHHSDSTLHPPYFEVLQFPIFFVKNETKLQTFFIFKQ